MVASCAGIAPVLGNTPRAPWGMVKLIGFSGTPAKIYELNCGSLAVRVSAVASPAFVTSSALIWTWRFVFSAIATASSSERMGGDCARHTPPTSITTKACQRDLFMGDTFPHQGGWIDSQAAIRNPLHPTP